MYDAIFVGARVAGSPAAMLMARKGYRVLLVDKATFPSDTLSSHYIHQPGIAALKRWGLRDRLIARGGRPFTHGTVDLGPFALRGWGAAVDGVGEAIAPRRTVLDALLVEAAVEAGAELREGYAVDQILMDGDQVTGIRGRTRGGAAVTDLAPIVVGADGKRSLVARAAAAPMYHVKPALTCYYYSYYSGVPLTGLVLAPREGRTVAAYPTNDGLVCVNVGWRNEDFHRVRAGVEEAFLETLDGMPELGEMVRAGRREERFYGTADLPNFFRRPFGPGWALVGDAGYTKDPGGGYGITDAFRDAELLAEALDAGLSGRRPLEQSLADYEQRRNAVALPMYELITELATLSLSAEMEQLLFALQGNQEQINRLFGVIDGTVPTPEFFAPENIGRIMAAAAARVEALDAAA